MLQPLPLPFRGRCLVGLFFYSLLLLQIHLGLSVVILKLRHHHHHSTGREPEPRANKTNCNLFSGTWEVDSSYPLYDSRCPMIDPQFNCKNYGRPDSDYQRYRWKPFNCDLRRFDGVGFVMKMREKKIMFVGDSLGRDQWESLVCMIYSSVPHTQTQLIRGEPLSIFKLLDYELSISYYKARYLVDIDDVQGRKILKLDDISENAKFWEGQDVLVFNSGHWWTHTTDKGWDLMEDGGTYSTDMDRMIAFEKALRTWGKWAENSLDRTKTRLFFSGYSPQHYDSSEWNAPVSKNCYGETKPVPGSTYAGPYPKQMMVIKNVIAKMSYPPSFLDITTLSELRKDAHPSVYSGNISPLQANNPDKYADCSHWCLPGLPDTWNELFYNVLFL